VQAIELSTAAMPATLEKCLMRIALIGCGFVADQYVLTMRAHAALEIAGVYDRDPQRLAQFCDFHGLKRFDSIEPILSDSSIQIVVNLTNPSAHFDISKTCLEAGKHVYCEKPLAMEMCQARQLVELAKSRGLQISSAPSTVFSETAQTMWKALRQKRVGTVRLVYAEMDDGLVHRMPYRDWKSASGKSWPWRDEFEVGCTIEHAGYCLSWLAAFFGPATSVTAFSTITIPDKQTDEPLNRPAPDLSIGCIQYASGVVARVTCSIVAPHDHRLMVVGDEGILWTKDTWYTKAPVYLKRYLRIRRRVMLQPWKTRCPLLGKGLPKVKYRGASRVDWGRGVADLADAVANNRPARLSADFSLHINELTLALNHAGTHSSTVQLTTTFEPMEPLSWAMQ
jgi:predicted dehydrogenase